MRFFRFDAFDFSCNSASKMLDINCNITGDITNRFLDYTTEANENLIRTAWVALGYSNIYQPALEIISRYPENFKCQEITSTHDIKNQQLGMIESIKNYPHPFNPSARIEYSLNKPSNVKLSIFNFLGQRIKILCNSFQNTGNYSVVWDGRDQNNNPVNTGIYFINIELENQNLYKKMVLIR